MRSVFQDLALWFWRLVPANPILVRVIFAGGRRTRHLWIRIGYLTVLAIAVVIGVIATQTGSSSLSELAKEATKVFKYLSIIQLAMVCVLAPVFAAAAITQEKDSQTYNILLSTPLTNGQIVLGSLLSRLYFVLVLLLAGIPLFCIMMVYGGVTGDKIALSMLLAGATALLTGTLAITISVIKIGTGRTIFSFYLAIAIYLIAVYSLSSSWASIIPPEAASAPGRIERMSWLAAFHPFLALWVILGQTPAPDFGAVAHYGFPGSYLLAYPHYSFMAMSVVISGILVVVSLAFVRRGAKLGETTWFSRMIHRGNAGRPVGVGELTRKPRRVKRNPIAWRESVTGAAAAGGAMVRYLIVGGGLCLALTRLLFSGTGRISPAETRLWLYGIVITELLITLFLATTTAATSMTREKESNTLELLLATPLTSGSIITGKIWGLVYAAGPMLLMAYLTVGMFIAFDGAALFLGGSNRAFVVKPEAIITLPVLFVAFTAFACMVGLQSSIKSKKTIGAVFTSMGIVIGIFLLAGSCAYMMQNAGSMEEMTAAFMPLTPPWACFIAIDPESALGGINTPLSNAATISSCRIIAFVSSFCSAGIYFLVGWSMHRSMVRNFDMIIRKQTA